MEFLEGSYLMEHLLRRYSRNPKDWSFVIAPSGRHGFFDALVSNGDEAWQLKMDSIFKSTPLILGARSEANLETANSPSPVSYGYRKLDVGLGFKLLEELQKTEKQPREKYGVSRLFRILGSLETVVPEPGESYAQGPFVFATQGAIKLSEYQRTLDEKLTTELQGIMRNRYPSYG